MKIENQIKQFIQKNLYFAEDSALEDDASFLETGVVDSTGVMELVAFVQTEFGITVEPQEIVVENFDSVNKLAWQKLPDRGHRELFAMGWNGLGLR